MKKLRMLDHQALVTLNQASVQARRRQNLRAEQIPTPPYDRYWINAHAIREGSGQREIRVSIVLSLRSGQTAWLDVSPEEFAAIPEVEVSEFAWEAVMCTGNPPAAP
jgi:hypothetical protein